MHSTAEKGCQDDQDELDVLLDAYTAEAAEQNRRLQAKTARSSQPRSMAAGREAGLHQPLGAGNKGYQLLRKLGYQEGKGLGSGRQGRSEPLPLDLKSGRAGLGVDEQRRRERQERQAQEEQERAKRARLTAEQQQRFQSAVRSDHSARQAVRHLMGAWRVVEQLDERQPTASAAAAATEAEAAAAGAVLDDGAHTHSVGPGRSAALQRLLRQLPDLVAMLGVEDQEEDQQGHDVSVEVNDPSMGGRSGRQVMSDGGVALGGSLAREMGPAAAAAGPPACNETLKAASSEESGGSGGKYDEDSDGASARQQGASSALAETEEPHQSPVRQQHDEEQRTSRGGIMSEEEKGRGAAETTLDGEHLQQQQVSVGAMSDASLEAHYDAADAEANGEPRGQHEMKDGPRNRAVSSEAVAPPPATVFQQLETLLRYLRERHCYCYFCGCQYNSTEDLEANCPGLMEESH